MKVQCEVRGGRVTKSRSGDGSTLAPPRSAALTARSTVSRTSGGIQGPTPSLPQRAEPALADDRQQLADNGQQLADENMASVDGQNEDKDGQSEVSED